VYPSNSKMMISHF